MTARAQEERGVGLEYLDRLTLFDDTFTYDGATYAYADITHVQFTAVATKHSVNFIPTGTSYEATLFLELGDGRRLHIKQERPFFNRKEKHRSEAVMRAAGIFLNVTFDRRIETYERHMEEKGFINVGKHQISRDGDLFRNTELRSNILNGEVICHLGPFQVECRKSRPGIGDKLKGLWTGGAEVIDISTDRDCFLYIMKHYFRLTWPGQTIPEKRKSGKEVFNEALLVLGAKLCKADGRVSAEEIVVFKRYFGIDESTHPGASKMFMEAAQTTKNTRKTANRIFELLSGKTEALEYILIGLMQIAEADGRMDASERTFIGEVAETFAFSDEAISRLFLLFEQTQHNTYRERSTTSRTHATSLRSEYLQVLGLDESTAFSEIKSAYRDLVRKHHPDLLRSQGVPIDDMKHAEEILKAINRAYEWLKHHDTKATI